MEDSCEYIEYAVEGGRIEAVLKLGSGEWANNSSSSKK
jgi:hypothetical protein